MTRVLPSKAERHRLFGSVEPIEGTKPKTKDEMTDLQNKPADYFFPIQQVGISKVKYPVMVESTWAPETQTATAEFKLTTNLGADYKGINMSRLTEQLHAFYQVHLLSPETLRELAAILAREMDQTGAQIEVSFPWFFLKEAPSSKKEGLAHAEVTYRVEFDEATGWKTEISLEAAVTTLCPCSKEISEYSAHNQRGFVTMTIRTTEDSQTDWKTALIEAAESNASSILYPVLKRPDEKAVTERAYENPRFVEDLARLVAADLYEHDEVREFTIHCRNEESIHQHDAVAKLHYNKDQN
ncbi:GTP cyclohydrolase FolE2 [Alkalicoccobacillus murimartini]|uniref:GTP cyclohydrolase FolE2 n=1 Tax=Alkalicoccobacillus murimartini TaxID=171685 RepID=A0ABT9YCV3_9BACI|nr:GTP cyclohydrolase FolE2 [Alkalicoccobacillus murimartini]MDQ0205652.1 GTP cyclohydrolase I [Alkalicoccobacillus murimartini]